MASGKTIYWLAVALMAVFMGNHFANKYGHGCIADRAIAAIQHFSAEASDVDSHRFGDSSNLWSPRLAMARRQGQFAAMEQPWFAKK